MPVMSNSLSALPSGWQTRVLYPCVPFSSNIYDVFSIQTLQDNPYKLAAPHPSLGMGYPPQLFNPLADGLPMPSKFIFGRTQSSSKHYCLAKQHAQIPSLSTLWNPNCLYYFLQTFPWFTTIYGQDVWMDQDMQISLFMIFPWSCSFEKIHTCLVSM